MVVYRRNKNPPRPPAIPAWMTPEDVARVGHAFAAVTLADLEKERAKVERQGVIKVQRALRKAVEAMEDTGFDTYRIREILTDVDNRIENPREKPKPTNYVERRAEVTPEERRRGVQERAKAAAYSSPQQQLAYERAYRILAVAVNQVIKGLRLKYPYHVVRFAVTGALNRLAMAATDLLNEYERVSTQEDDDARAAFLDAASRRPTPPQRIEADD